MRSLRAICTLLCIVSRCAGQTNNTTVAATTPSPTIPSSLPTAQSSNAISVTCSCDLSASPICTPNCCCDSDCTSGDIDTFTHCTDAVNRSLSRVCVSDYLIMTSNLKYTTERISSSNLFCVQKDNNPNRNIFISPDLVTTQEEFSARISTTSYAPNKASSTSDSLYYRFGDPIQIVYSSSSYASVLSLPIAVGGDALCHDGNIAGFLRDTSATCTRYLAHELLRECTENPSLRASSYFEGFQIKRLPSVDDNDLTYESGVGENVTVSSETENVTVALIGIELEKVLCVTSENFLTVDCDIAMPTFANGTCRNVAMEISYIIFHNATQGILSATAQIVLGTVTSSFEQKFSIRFEKSGTGNETGIPRSGNPGYVIGKPIIAGKSVNGRIELSSNPLNWLTIPSPAQPPGYCTQIAERKPILYKEDVRTGCLISVTYRNLTESCDYLQSIALSILRGPDLPTHIATFGNPDPLNASHWVQIIFNPTPEKTVAVPGSGLCANVPVGLHIEVLHSLSGPITNPQAQLVGAQYSYITQDIQFKCVGPLCLSEMTMWIEFSVSVAFIDVTRPPSQLTKPPFSLRAKLPEDFFFPFFSSSAELMYSNNILLIIVASIARILLL